MNIDMQTFHDTLSKAAAAAPHEVRRHDAMAIGHVAMQGDCYLHRIAKKPAVWDVETTNETRQVALGSTVGSRHCADGSVRVYWPKSKAEAVAQCPIKGFVDRLGAGAEPCIGPVVVADAEWTLTHPEHAHHVLPAGIYLTTFQLDRRTMREVRD